MTSFLFFFFFFDFKWLGVFFCRFMQVCSPFFVDTMTTNVKKYPKNNRFVWKINRIVYYVELVLTCRVTYFFSNINYNRGMFLYINIYLYVYIYCCVRNAINNMILIMYMIYFKKDMFYMH
ncbi:MAG: hypothetical protein CSA21_05100 [Deltaproteobacteria bacterium]|nr:MAG: hypothetical protein CSA21_05100 [Deltaproteobacteria bacterium]